MNSKVTGEGAVVAAAVKKKALQFSPINSEFDRPNVHQILQLEVTVTRIKNVAYWRLQAKKCLKVRQKLGTRKKLKI